MAMLKIPLPNDRGHLLFDVGQIANVEVRAGDAYAVSLRLRGERTRLDYQETLASHVHHAILVARCAGKEFPIIEVQRDHYTEKWCVFHRQSAAMVGSGKGEPDDEGGEAG